MLPYAVKAAPVKGLHAGSQVTFVAYSADFWQRNSKGEHIFPKHIQNCDIKKVYAVFDPTCYGANCDAAGHASGGGALSEDSGQVVLSAIFKTGPGTIEQDLRAIEMGEKLMAPYREKAWAAYFVPVAGDFLRAIQKATE